MKYQHTFKTASPDTRDLIKDAAAEYGLEYREEYAPTCIKKYHLDVTAQGSLQTRILDLIIMSVWGPGEYETKLRVMIAAKRAESIAAC